MEAHLEQSNREFRALQEKIMQAWAEKVREQNRRCRAKPTFVVATNVVVPTDGLLDDKEEPAATRAELPCPERESKWNAIVFSHSRVAIHQAKAGPCNRTHDGKPTGPHLR
ncbi:hypothetical protein Dimus_030598, partial [Dionaea muscipula]